MSWVLQETVERPLKDEPMWLPRDYQSAAVLPRPLSDVEVPGYERPRRLRIGVPPTIAEYGFYLSIAYATLGEALGLALIPGFGALIIAVVCVLCVKSVGLRGIRIFLPIAFILAFACCFVAVQVLVHNETIFASGVRPYIPWIFTLLTAQALMLRKGFLSRFAICCSAIGVLGLSFMKSWTEEGRVGLEQGVAFANPNDLALWFGFAAVYFIVAAIETKRNWTRLFGWGVAGLCFFVIGMTVSRSTLFAGVIALLVASRRVLKRGFLPLLVLLVVAGMAWSLGLFDAVVSSYMQRGMSSSGRLEVLPVAWERLQNRPYVGYGISNVATFVPVRGDFKTPHNAFLTIGLAGGLVSLFPFILQLLFTGWQLIRWRVSRVADAPFYLPLSAYVFLGLLFSNGSYTSPYTAVTISAVSLPFLFHQLQKSLPGGARGVGRQELPWNRRNLRGQRK